MAALPASDSTENIDDLRCAAISHSPAVAGALPEGDRPFDLRLRTFEKSSLRWYLEQYINRPVGGFVHRASEVESTLRYWAQALLPAALGPGADLIIAKLLDGGNPSHLTIESDSSAILALPWELAAVDGRSLAEIGVIVRRQPVGRGGHDHWRPPRTRCMRILLVVSRPNEMGYIDHCRTARLLDDVARLHPGKLEVDLCRPATMTRLEGMLKQASDAGRPYGVVHFDGHGAYNPLMLRGELCFEGVPDAEGRVAREVVSARTLGSILARYTRPTLLVLEACQTAQVTPPLMGAYSPLVGTLRDLKDWARTSLLKPSFENCVDIAHSMSPEELRANAPALAQLGLGAALDDRYLADVPLPQSAVGAAIAAGVESVIGMSYSAHVDATACFMREIYAGLATGRSIGEAVDAGRLALKRSRARRTPCARAAEFDSIELEDWFVPQLYQAGEDYALTPAVSAAVPGSATPAPLGRGCALLDAERRLLARPALLVRGLAGSGKTTFAHELAYWMARSKEFPDGVYSVSAIDGAARDISITRFDVTRSNSPASPEVPALSGWVELGSWLSMHRALVIIDAIESLLFPDTAVPEAEAAYGFLDFVCATFEAPNFAGRLLTTTRLGRDNPVTAKGVETIDLEPLAPGEAVELLERQLTERDRGHALAELDAEVRLDILNRLAGNPRAIMTAGANWPDAAATAGPEMVDGWMAGWAEADNAKEDDDRLGVAAWPLSTLPPLAHGMLALLAGLRGTVALDHIGRLQPIAPEQWREILAAWAQMGLAEPAADEKRVHRLHPWLPYRLRTIDRKAVGRTFGKPLALLYGTLFSEVANVGPRQPRGFAQWIAAEWATLRLQLAEALDRHDPGRALSVGLVLDDLLAAAGLQEARLRLLRNLEAAMGKAAAGELGLELRLRVCDWALGHRQRNDAVAVAAAALLEIDASPSELAPGALGAALVHLGDVLRDAGYRHASLLVYCRSAAVWIEQVRELEDQRRYQTFHLAECLGRLADVLADAGRLSEAWSFVDRQFMACCAGIGGSNLSVEPFVRYARLLVRERRFDAAESLFGTLLEDTSRLGDRSLAAWFECRGDLHAWRRKFDEAAHMCTWALSIYERRRDYASILACHRHMGVICMRTGSYPEAKSWFRSALEMAWQRSDVSWVRSLLNLLQQADRTILEALRLAGKADAHKQLIEEIRPFYLEQGARLKGLEEYCAEADAWVRRALKLDENASPESIPEEFDAAAEILQRLAPREKGPSETATTTVDAASRLNEELAPHDQDARAASIVTLLMLRRLLAGPDETQTSAAADGPEL